LHQSQRAFIVLMRIDTQSSPANSSKYIYVVNTIVDEMLLDLSFSSRLSPILRAPDQCASGGVRFPRRCGRVDERQWVSSII
jgi:hypothetical protein